MVFSVTKLLRLDHGRTAALTPDQAEAAGISRSFIIVTSRIRTATSTSGRVGVRVKW